MLKTLYNSRNFSTKVKIEPFVQLYGYALRDKFADICRADLIGKILNKSENNIMLLRSDFINTSHVNKIYLVYNGYMKITLRIKKNMVGFRVGEFVPSRKIKYLNDENTLVRKVYKSIQKPKKVLSKDRRVLISQHFNFIKTLYIIK